MDHKSVRTQENRHRKIFRVDTVHQKFAIHQDQRINTRGTNKRDQQSLIIDNVIRPLHPEEIPRERDNNGFHLDQLAFAVCFVFENYADQRNLEIITGGKNYKDRSGAQGQDSRYFIQSNISVMKLFKRAFIILIIILVLQYSYGAGYANSRWTWSNNLNPRISIIDPNGKFTKITSQIPPECPKNYNHHGQVNHVTTAISVVKFEKPEALQKAVLLTIYKQRNKCFMNFVGMVYKEYTQEYLTSFHALNQNMFGS